MKCRICDSDIKKYFLSLGNSPLSNSYLKKEELNKMEPYYPLDLFFCEKCFLVQLDEFEKARNIFSDEYAYFSSYSESWLSHCEKYTKMMIDRFGYSSDSFVIEIASNDGYLLQYFKKNGVPVLGIEPTANTARVAIEKGIETDMVFFDTAYAKKLKSDGRMADLIIGNNVIAHNPKLNDFVNGLKYALKPAGIITMEFPHLMNLIKNNQFDTIYHEHFSYFSLHTIKILFEKFGLTVFDVDEIPTHGGSLRIYAKHAECTVLKISNNVETLLEKEKSAGLLAKKTFIDYSEKVRSTKRNILKFLIKAKEDGKKIVGYGAPAKGNTLLNYCGIGMDFIEYTVDRSPHKQNRFLPGTHIPVKEPDEIIKDRPDYILILPWNIKSEIIAQMSCIREWGGKFIVPIPQIDIL